MRSVRLVYGEAGVLLLVMCYMLRGCVRIHLTRGHRSIEIDPVQLDDVHVHVRLYLQLGAVIDVKLYDDN